MSGVAAQLLFLRRCLRLFWFLAGAGLVIWLVLRNIPPSGRVSVMARTAEPNGFIGGFTPLDRAVPVQEQGVWFSDVSQEPVYFSLAAPRLYDAMNVRLRYKNEGQPYVALGARADLSSWSFDVKPLDLPMLDQSGWASRQDGLFRIYERKGTLRTTREILDSATARVAVVGTDPVRWGLRLPNLDAEKPFDTEMNEPGTRRMYVYVTHGPLEVSLGLHGPEQETAHVSLVKRDATLLTRTLQGDGSVDLSLTGAEPGLYRIDLEAPSDVSLVHLHSRHGRFVLLETAGERLHPPAGAVRFDPEFPVVTWETDMKTAPYDVVIAHYQPPTTDADGWREASVSFNLRAVAASQGRVQMVLSLPAIKRVGGKVRIDDVTVQYEREPFDLKRVLRLLTPKP